LSSERLANEAVEGWIETTAFQLLAGQRLLVRLPPRIGKSHLTSRLGKALGDSAVVVDGATFTEANQGERRDAIELGLQRAIEAHGSAQLIFDSYDRAISRSQGARLQTWLSSRIIDGQHARDIGALFTARCSTEVHRAGAGSPLISRVTPVDPPSTPTLGSEASDVAIREWFGQSALLADRAHASGTFSPTALADTLELDLSYIDDVRGASSIIIEAGAVDEARDSFAARSAVYGLMSKDGPTKLLDRLRPLLLASPADDPTWPNDWSAGVQKFAQLVAGATEVIWSDRYIYRDIEPLRHFLKAVLAKSNCTIRLLGTHEVSGRTVSRAEMARLTALPGVDARFMTQADYRDLHDRHLVTGQGGWVVPQAHVIVGKQSPGSTVAAPAVSFGVDYSAVWRRSLVP